MARCDVVLAVGGGSGLGAAKGVAIRLTNDGTSADFEGVEHLPNPPAPTVAVPTTAGSGSEVSKVLVLHEPGRDDELVIRVDGGAPEVAILDAEILRGVPRSPMLFAGLAALSHSFDAQWAWRSSWFTSELARSVTRAILDTLPAAVAGAKNGRNVDGHNDELLQQLLEASSAANMACGNSGLTLVHALSGAPSIHLPHGYQNGIRVLHIACFNHGCSDDETWNLAARLDGLYETLDFEGVCPAGSMRPDSAKAMGGAPTTSSDETIAENLRTATSTDC